jgi:hypothetical protein
MWTLPATVALDTFKPTIETTPRDKSQGTSGPQEGEGIMKENYLNNFVQATLMPSRFPDRPGRFVVDWW